MKTNDYFSQFENQRDLFFEENKLKYFKALDEAKIHKKEDAHNIFRNEILEPESKRLRNELGQRQRFLIDINNICDFGKSKCKSVVFNEKILDVPEDERDDFLTKLASYYGMYLMYNYWNLKGGYDNSYIELLLLRQPELSVLSAALFEATKNNFISKLNVCENKKEQYKCITEEISNIHFKNGNVLFEEIYNLINLPKSLILSNKNNFIESFPQLIKLFSSKNSIQSNELYSIMDKSIVVEIETSEANYLSYSKVLKENEKINGSLENIENGLKSFEGFIYIIVALYYRKLYLEYLSRLDEELSKSVAENNNITANEIIEHRQALAIIYLLGELNVNSSNTDKTEIAKFIRFLQGKDLNVKISNTNLYKRIGNPLDKSDKNIKSDLCFILTFFEKLNLNNVVKEINKDINSIK